MASIICQICLGHFSCSQYSVFICGHGCCKSCVDTLFIHSRTPRSIPCPVCRTNVRKHDIHTIFLDFVESKTSFTNAVTEGFAKMDVDTPLESVKRAAEKIEKGAKVSKGNADLTTQLLQSIEDFKLRIIPVFEKVQTQRQEIQSLQNRISNDIHAQGKLQQRLTRLETLPNEISRLQNQLDNATRLADEATLAAEGIKNEMVTLRNDRDSYMKIAAELDAEKRRISDQVERNALSARASHVKYKAARNELKELKEKYRLAEEQHNALASPMTTQVQQEYPDDYSSYKSSRTPMNGHAPSEDSSEFEFEGMPRRGFGSDWQLNNNRSYGALSKARPTATVSTHRRVANPPGFPLKLDRNGHPTSAVQLGPKRSRKI